MLRVVPTKAPSFLLVKNIGRGPAVSVSLFDKRPETVIAELDLVEPLGPRPSNGEVYRVGRREIHLGQDISVATPYRLAYQDIAGRWHETVFLRNRTSTLTVLYLGPRSPRKIPKTISSKGQVTTETEFE